MECPNCHSEMLPIAYCDWAGGAGPAYIQVWECPDCGQIEEEQIGE